MGTKFSLSLITVAATVGVTPAYAGDIQAAGPPPLLVAVEAMPQAVVVIEPVSAGADIANPVPLADGDLDELRGGESLVVGNQTLVAITSGNVIAGDYTAGSVSLSDFALSNFNGIGNLLINTGGQVSLQTGMNLIINVGE